MEILTPLAAGLGSLLGIIISVNLVGKLIIGWKASQKCEECHKALSGMKEVVATMEKMAKLEADKDEHIDILKAHIKLVLKQYWQAAANYDQTTPT